MRNKLAVPLSVLLGDAVLTRHADRVKAVEVIGIYSEQANIHNLRKYFNDVGHIELGDGNVGSIEELISISSHPLHWNEEWSLKIHFRGGDFPEQYYNEKTESWE